MQELRGGPKGRDEVRSTEYGVALPFLTFSPLSPLPSPLLPYTLSPASQPVLKAA